MKKLVLAILFIAFIIPLNAQTKKELKNEAEAKEYADMKSLVDSKEYVFEADWASTQKGRRINLISNPNFLRMDQENADIDMPYFGVVQSPSVGFGGEGGIVFKGAVDNYDVQYNDKKQKAVIKFKAKGKSDHFTFTLTVFKNNNATLYVSSNSRNGISYDGKVAKLEKAVSNKQ
ncbi:MAG: DUF4251 domain-containing protein [Bacteroidota bacterium]